MEFVTIDTSDWDRAMDSEGFNAYKESAETHEFGWGVAYVNYLESEEKIEYLVIDKCKWFLAKIKHGF